MEPEARYTLVGSAVLLLFALLAAAVVWLRSTGAGADDLRYKIYFENQSLEGLAVRSDVLMRGIRVGSVTGFRFSARRPEAVEVFLIVERGTPVRTNTQAVVDRHLVTGIASVRLVNPNEEAPLLTEAPPGEPYPVIAEGESALAQVTETVNDLAVRAADTLERLNAALSDENQEAIAETLASIRGIAERTESALATLQTTLATLDRTLGSVDGAAREATELARALRQDARTLTARYDKLGAQAAGSLEEIEGALGRLAADAARLAQSGEALVAASDAEVRATGQALREAADALAAAARGFDDPRRALFGPPEGALGPGEGRP